MSFLRQAGLFHSYPVRLFAEIAILCITGFAYGQEEKLPSIADNDNLVSAGQLSNGVLAVRLELREGHWFPAGDSGPGVDIYSFAEQGRKPQTPGPLIRVPAGTEIQAIIRNLLPIAASVHGLHQHPDGDKEPLRILPGEEKQARFLAGEPGTYLYWAETSGNPLRLRADKDTLLSGAFIVDPAGEKPRDRVFVIQYWYKDFLKSSFQEILSINGKSWPHTERIQVYMGRPVHWRIVNSSVSEHPMHLHGFFFRVDAVSDGEQSQTYAAAERRSVVTESVDIGHTFDMTWVPQRAGNWLFHCHLIDHMSNEKTPLFYGVAGPPRMAHLEPDDPKALGMSGLVLGISVISDASTGTSRPTSVRPARKLHLYVRHRPAAPYVPEGPGFYLEGTSRETSAIGPPIILTRGEPAEITVTNELAESTSIHWHGIELESYYDGVPGWTGSPSQTTPVIMPGASFLVRITPPRAGTFIYHTHWHHLAQLTGGLYGPLIVTEPGQSFDPETDKIWVIGRAGPDERTDPLFVNGSAQPPPITLKLGQSYRLRLINITPNDAPVAVSLVRNGQLAKWRAVAKDGAGLQSEGAAERNARQPISVGETYDFEFKPAETGFYELGFFSIVGTKVTQVLRVAPAAR